MDVDGTQLPARDDQWRLDEVSERPARIRLHNISTGHFVELESDNVQERRSPDFLLLRCNVIISARGIAIEPISRGTPIGTVAPISDLFVSLDYPERAGIGPRLRAEGYTLRWIRADQEAKRVCLESWDYVEDVGDDHSRVRFKVEDPLCRYLVLVKKKASSG